MLRIIGKRRDALRKVAAKGVDKEKKAKVTEQEKFDQLLIESYWQKSNQLRSYNMLYLIHPMCFCASFFTFDFGVF